MRREYDVIIAGAGVNGLACGAYLARAGLEVAVVERRNECGPFALTEDLFGAGVPIDTHAGVCFVTMSPVYGDLELDRFGLDLIFPRVPTGTVSKDGTNVIYYRDLDKTCEELGRFSERDARTFREMREKIMPHAVEILESSGSGKRLREARDLGTTAVAWLRDPDAVRARGEAGYSALEHHRGAAERAACLVLEALRTRGAGESP